MPGLLDTLQSSLAGSGVTDAISAQSGLLQQVITTAGSLSGGPSALTEVEGLLSGGGVPRLDSGPLAALGGGIAGLPIPADLAGPLAPILTPLQGLVGLEAGFGAALAGLEVIRGVVELATRRSFAGTDALPFGLGAFGPLGKHGLPSTDFDADEARQAVLDAIAVLEAQPEIGPERFVALVRRVGSAFDIHAKWPRVPGISEAAEALQTIGRWETVTAEVLTADLARSTALAAQVIALPRTRIADPLITAAQRAGSLDTTLASAVSSLLPQLDGLRAATRPGGAAPGAEAISRLEREVAALETVVAALDLSRGPLSTLEALPANLELALLRSLRALLPSADVSSLVTGATATLAAIPAADGAVFADVQQSITDLDLSALTDPLTRVRDAVQSAVQAVEDGKDTVRQGLVDLLQPVDDALASLISAAGLDTLPARIEDLRQQLQTFVQDEIVGRLQPIQDGVSGLVTELSDTIDQLDLSTVLQPIRDALHQLTELLAGDAVNEAIGAVEQALQDAVEAIEAFTLAPATDQVVGGFESIEAKIREIDPSKIPDPAKELLKVAVDGIVNIDITGEVSEPITTALHDAIEDGPGRVVRELRAQTQQLKDAIDGFKPSQLVGDAVQRPFDELVATLRDFRPSALLGRLQAALNQLVSAVTVDGLTALLDPLEDAWNAAREGIESLRPSKLLKPVEDAIEAAVAEVMRASGADDALDGINSLVDGINAWLGVLVSARDGLNHVARVLESPGDADAALAALVDDAVTRLADADVTALAGPLAAAQAASAAVRGDVILGELAIAVRSATDHVPAALTGDDARRVKEAVRAFPLSALDALPPQTRRRQLADLVRRLLRVADTLDAAGPVWASPGHLRETIAAMPPRLDSYARLFRYEGADVFASFTQPVASAAALQAQVRPVLERDLRPALQLAWGLLRALGPHVAVIARGLGDVLVAVEAKMATITGDEGIGGIVDGINDIADLLRDIDLTPITDPLDAIWGRIEGAWGNLDPAGLRPLLEQFGASLGEVLNIGNLVDADATAALDSTYLALVHDLEQLSPRELIASTLDPAFAEAMRPVERVLALPDRLQELIDTAAEHVPDDAMVQLARVEVAFDKMLRALPTGSGGGASGSASASVG